MLCQFKGCKFLICIHSLIEFEEIFEDAVSEPMYLDAAKYARNTSMHMRE